MVCTNTVRQRKPFPPPSAFGAPDRYTDWRPEQLTALFQVSDSEKRFRQVLAPCGSGKTLLAQMLVAMHGGRGLILTELLGLMDQHIEDARGSGYKIADLRGANNYPCPALQPGGRYQHLADSRRGTNCDAGPCRSGLPCHLRSNGCPYYDAERRAANADIVVSNYAKHLVTDEDNESIGTFDWLILDEVHRAPAAVSSALSVDINLDQIEELLNIGSPGHRRSIGDWREWGQLIARRSADQHSQVREDLRLARESGTVDRYDLDRLAGLQQVVRTAEKLQKLSYGEWIITRPRQNSIKFNILWPRKHNQLLFRGIENVVGLSATAPRKTFNYLGLDDSEFDFFELPSSFPVANRPVYIIPFAFVQWNMNADSTRKWLSGIDTLFGKHGEGRRVLVDTISYDRQQFLLENSRYGHRMITPRHSKETARAVKFFREQSPEDAILSGPSFSGGYNFPGSQCELAVATKLSFPDLRDPVTKARCESDPSFKPYEVMQRLQQFAGRLVRSRRDRGMTVVADGHAMKFFDPAEGNRKYAARYFLDAVHIVRNGLLPKPLPKLTDEEIRLAVTGSPEGGLDDELEST